MGSGILDLIHGHRTPPPSVAGGAATPKVAIPATDRKNPTKNSKRSNFGHEPSPTEITVSTNHPGQDPQEQEAHRLWDIRDGDGQWWSVSATPPATYREMARSWPDAISIRPGEETPDMP